MYSTYYVQHFLFAGKEQEVHPHLAVAEALHAHEAVPGPHGHVLPGDDASLQDPNLAVPEATQDHVPGVTLVQGPGTERNGQDFLDPEVDQDLQGGKEDHVVLGLQVIPGHGHHLIPDLKTDGGDLVAEADPMIDVDGHVLCQAPGIGDVGGHFPVVGLDPEIEIGEGSGPVRGPVLVTGEGDLGLVPDPRTGGGAFARDHIPGIATASWWHGVGTRLPHVKLVFVS